MRAPTIVIVVLILLGIYLSNEVFVDGENFVFGIDYTISFGCSTNAAPVASDGDFILGLMTDESNSVFPPVVLDALPLLGSVVNTSPPPAISFDQSREGIG